MVCTGCDTDASSNTFHFKPTKRKKSRVSQERKLYKKWQSLPDGSKSQTTDIRKIDTACPTERQ